MIWVEPTRARPNVQLQRAAAFIGTVPRGIPGKVLQTRQQVPRIAVRPINQAAIYTLYPIAAYEIGHMNTPTTISTVDFRTIFCSLADRIERAYSLKVNVGPVTGSYTGQFDGKEIWVDPDRDPEKAVFILAHLFGHTVQWNLDEKLRRLGLAVSGVTEQDLPRIYRYEREASRFGLALLRETGELRLARWLSDCFGADWKFLARFYRTGEKVRFKKEAGADEPLLSPLSIPSFMPQRWPTRGSF